MKKITYSEASICWNNIEQYIWEVTLSVQRCCACGISTAESLTEPLNWYIRTGRASCEFLHKLVKTKPYLVAHRLTGNGSTEEIMRKIKELVKYESYEDERSVKNEH